MYLLTPLRRVSPTRSDCELIKAFIVMSMFQYWLVISLSITAVSGCSSLQYWILRIVTIQRFYSKTVWNNNYLYSALYRSLIGPIKRRCPTIDLEQQYGERKAIIAIIIHFPYSSSLVVTAVCYAVKWYWSTSQLHSASNYPQLETLFYAIYIYMHINISSHLHINDITVP